MYREPRSLGYLQRLLLWINALPRYWLARRPVNPRIHAMETISVIADRLECSDFQIFERAHLSWYGVEGSCIALEREFGQCLNLQRDVPFYVRGYIGRIGVLEA